MSDRLPMALYGLPEQLARISANMEALCVEMSAFRKEVNDVFTALQPPVPESEQSNVFVIVESSVYRSNASGFCESGRLASQYAVYIMLMRNMYGLSESSLQLVDAYVDLAIAARDLPKTDAAPDALNDRRKAVWEITGYSSNIACQVKIRTCTKSYADAIGIREWGGNNLDWRVLFADLANARARVQARDRIRGLAP